jgi:hypothetical protein
VTGSVRDLWVAQRERDDAGARHSALVRRRTCVTAPQSPRFHLVAHAVWMAVCQAVLQVPTHPSNRHLKCQKSQTTACLRTQSITIQCQLMCCMLKVQHVPLQVTTQYASVADCVKIMPSTIRHTHASQHCTPHNTALLSNHPHRQHHSSAH